MNNSKQTTINILNILKKHRRVRGEHEGEFSLEPFIEKISGFVEKNLPIKILLSAFHCKSINENSVFGKEPDAAEEESIKHLENICEEIKKIYSPGCLLLIVHEGHFYTDIKITPNDDVIDKYEKEIHKMTTGKMIKFTNILSDYFSQDYNEAREIIFKKYMYSLEFIKKLIVEKKEIHDKYVAYKAFTTHEFAPVLMPHSSKSEIKKFSKEIAYKWLQRYLVFKRICDELFKEYFSISVLSYSAQSARFSINLIPGNTHLGMPWFHVLVKGDNRMELIKKHIAKKNKYKLIYFHDKPWFYQR